MDHGPDRPIQVVGFFLQLGQIDNLARRRTLRKLLRTLSRDKMTDLATEGCADIVTGFLFARDDHGCHRTDRIDLLDPFRTDRQPNELPSTRIEGFDFDGILDELWNHMRPQRTATVDDLGFGLDSVKSRSKCHSIEVDKPSVGVAFASSRCRSSFDLDSRNSSRP